VEKHIQPSRAQYIGERTEKLRAAFAVTRRQEQDAARVGWDASPVTTGRLCLEIWDVIKDEDWALVSNTFGLNFWPERLWPMERPYRHTRGLGAAGVGTGIGVAIGAALAHREHGRIVINIQPDGDLLYAPGALWTAAHHRIPLLTVMHNNRAYHQELMHIQRMANRHERGIERAGIGTTLNDPFVDFAKLAQSMGVWAEGPIHSPQGLGPALRRALAVVKKGEPALVDVATQPR
jgi:acetolactate synthase I/II/III large subunit